MKVLFVYLFMYLFIFYILYIHCICIYIYIYIYIYIFIHTSIAFSYLVLFLQKNVMYIFYVVLLKIHEIENTVVFGVLNICMIRINYDPSTLSWTHTLTSICSSVLSAEM